LKSNNAFEADPDIQLMLDFANGDDSAFNQIMGKYKGIVIGITRRYFNDRSRAEDIAQEVFLRIYLSKNKYKPKSKLSTWIFRITANLCLNDIRSRKREEGNLDLINDNTSSTDRELDIIDKLEKEELNETVRSALLSLPERQRLAVLLSKYDGLSYQEISKILNCSISAVDSILQRAKQTLKKQLNKYFKE
jgi:RNA polymerase sigma-70 factor (ECF subfamily)